MNNKNLAFSTRAIHSGYNPFENEGALNPPIHMTSTFCFENVEQGAARFAGEKEGHFYSRISNPTQHILEERMADLEDAESALATASGMGAITSALWSFLASGDKVVADMTLYGCTYAFFQHGLTRFGIEVEFVDFTDVTAVKSALTENTKAVYFETPVNPNMRVIDIREVSHAVHAYNKDIKVVVDNTYCTPALQKPIALGADIVVHSATKYLGGHGDLVSGVIVGGKEDIDLIRVTGLKDMTGAVISPISAFLIMRGLKTLELRMERHSKSAMEIASKLSEHSSVEVTYFPGLQSDPYHAIADKQMKHFGGMIAFELKGGFDAGVKFMNALNMIKRAVSLGDAETLCQHPASMTHSPYTPEERAKHGISEGLVRISVGLEDPEDIYADILQALDNI